MIIRTVENIGMLPSKIMGNLLSKPLDVERALTQFGIIKAESGTLQETIRQLSDDATDAIADSLGLRYRRVGFGLQGSRYEVTAPRRPDSLFGKVLPRRIVGVTFASDHSGAFRKVLEGSYHEQTGITSPRQRTRDYAIQTPADRYKVTAASEEAARIVVEEIARDMKTPLHPSSLRHKSIQPINEEGKVVEFRDNPRRRPNDRTG